MVQRCHITIGDLTTTLGVVVSAGSMLSVDGKKVALEGDLISCPACKSTGVIICDGPRLSDKWEGKYFALENDICACKCSPPSRLLPSQKRLFQTIEGSGAAASSKAGKAIAAAVALAPAVIALTHHEQVRIKDQDNNPMPNVPYHITDGSGKTYKGVTDAEGCCARVYTDGEQTLSILTGVLALEKW